MHNSNWVDASVNEFGSYGRIRQPAMPSRQALLMPAEVTERPRPPASATASMVNGSAFSPAEISQLEGDRQRLNLLFDDIEFFVNRLVQAQSAAAELERLEGSRRRSTRGRRENIVALMALTRLPNEQEIHQVLFEFRTAFNLLGKVRHNLTNSPSPLEVVRQLIYLLQIVESRTRSPYTGESCAPKVNAPAFTSETTELLRHTLTGNQINFMKSLGNSWWPDELVNQNGQTQANTSQQNGRLQRSASNGGSDQIPLAELSFSDRNAEFLDDIRARNAKAVKVMAEYAAKGNEELKVQRGEVLEVLNDDRQWWKVRNSFNQTGFCPCTVLRDIPDADEDDLDGRRPATNGYHNGIRKSSSVNGTADVVPMRATRAANGNGHSRPVTAIAANGNFHDFASELHSRVNGGNAAPRSQSLILPQRAKLTEESTSAEVLEWLERKKFSQQTVEALQGVNGKELFDLEKNGKQRLSECAPADARRLRDSVLLEKNRSGYMTPARRVLKEMLTKQQQKSEQQANGLETIDDL